MRYLVRARLRPEKREKLAAAIANRTLGRGSVAGGEYLRNMSVARRMPDGQVVWVEVCYCAEPLDEERPYWEEYFELESIKDAHARDRCRHECGTETWACSSCDCTERLEQHLAARGVPFDPGDNDE